MSLKSQIVVPVHDRTRPIARAVTSVLSDHDSGVIVVAHNLDPTVLELPSDPRIVVIRVDGYVGIAGHAFDAGIAAATAEWVGIMGSDDWFETGALQKLRAHGEVDGADGVIVPIAYQGGGRGFSPRTLRHRNLQAARDGLFYRTAPLGLFRRSVLQHSSYAFGNKFPVGEDLAVSAQLWTSGLSISYYPDDPAYVVGADATQRTTLSPRPLAEYGAAWVDIWNRPWVAQLDRPTRHALAVKILRIHVLGAIAARPEVSQWKEGDFAWLVSLMRRVLEEDPCALGPFRRTSARTLRALCDGDLNKTLAAHTAEREGGIVNNVIPQRFTALLEKDAPLRWTAVGAAHVIRRDTRKLFTRQAKDLPVPSVSRLIDLDRSGSILILSFSPIVNDARVLRQVNLLKDDYSVTTCGFGEAPEGVVEHIELDASLLPTQLDGRLITLRAYRLAFWFTPAIRRAWRVLRGRDFDVILANDIETLPIALRLKPRLGVHADLHEHYPSMHEYDEAWKRRISPYLSWLCANYATSADSSTTVSSGLQRDYEHRFGFSPGLVPNATPFAELAPTLVKSPLRLVHSGAGLRNRQLEVMLSAVRDSIANITFDLFLTLNDPAYIEELRHEFAGDKRIAIHDPVPYAELVETLNNYDVGVFVLPPRTFSYEWALPNKYFDFVQARLGILIGPSPEMARYVREIGNGAVASNFEAEALRKEIDALTPAVVDKWKRASDAAARKLAAENQSQAWSSAVDVFFAKRR